jgi:hypothetical protein
MVLMGVQAFRAVGQPIVVDVAVWPQSVEGLEPGQQAQFYVATLYEDGTAECDMATASGDPAVAYNKADWPGACDSALARLALPQDQPPFLRFTWDAQPDSVVAAYDSIHYRVLMHDVSLGSGYVFDSLRVHPDTTFDWHSGVGDATYWVAVYVQGFGRDSVFASPRSDSTIFGYPHPDSLYGPLPPLPTLLRPSPVRVDTVSGGG